MTPSLVWVITQIRTRMKIHIVNYEQGFNNGILTKYATKMHEGINALGYECTISNQPNKEADINHHINYISARPSGKIDTTMVTHITPDQNRTREDKVNLIKEQSNWATGIAMSPRMADVLRKEGVKKITSVLPAHDSIPRRHQIIAVLTNIYPDNRKRGKMFMDLARSIDNSKWAFRIMGTGWSDMLAELVPKGLQVDYFAEFNMEWYKKILETADYLLYMGKEDCLAQSIIDAKQAGVKVIAPPQYDIEVDYPFETQEELSKIIHSLWTNPVETWTWENYCRNHIEIWEKLYEAKSGK